MESDKPQRAAPRYQFDASWYDVVVINGRESEHLVGKNFYGYTFEEANEIHQRIKADPDWLTGGNIKNFELSEIRDTQNPVPHRRTSPAVFKAGMRGVREAMAGKSGPIAQQLVAATTGQSNKRRDEKEWDF